MRICTHLLLTPTILLAMNYKHFFRKNTTHLCTSYVTHISCIRRPFIWLHGPQKETRAWYKRRLILIWMRATFITKWLSMKCPNGYVNTDWHYWAMRFSSGYFTRFSKLQTLVNLVTNLAANLHLALDLMV